MQQVDNVLFVGKESSPTRIAGIISVRIREFGECNLQCIGAHATNQAVKALAVARGFLSPNGYEIYCIPTFKNITVTNAEGEESETTGIRFFVGSRSIAS